MILFKFLLAIAGIAVISVALFCFFTEITEMLGLIAGMIGAVPVILIFTNDSVMEFFGLSNDLIYGIAFLAMVGGGIICAMDFEKLGSAMITAGWIAIGLILLQVVPIPFISDFIQVVAVPFIVAIVPIILLIMFVI